MSRYVLASGPQSPDIPPLGLPQWFNGFCTTLTFFQPDRTRGCYTWNRGPGASARRLISRYAIASGPQSPDIPPLGLPQWFSGFCTTLTFFPPDQTRGYYIWNRGPGASARRLISRYVLASGPHHPDIPPLGLPQWFSGFCTTLTFFPPNQTRGYYTWNREPGASARGLISRYAIASGLRATFYYSFYRSSSAKAAEPPPRGGGF
jgi:hypothetical protein